MQILQFCIIVMALFVWFVSIARRNVPHGLFEWLLTVTAVLIMVKKIFVYYLVGAMVVF